MTLNFTKSLQESLQKLGQHEYHEFVVHSEERILTNSDEVIDVYGKTKWAIVDLLNNNYSHTIKDKFDLYNWLNHNTNDEVSFFLNEAGSNCLNYSEHKTPHKFHLWLGEKGFIIGIEQQGNGFNAVNVDENRIKENEGRAFDFFRECQNEVFFDDANEARIIFFEQLF